MMLYIRMTLYAMSMLLAGQGLAIYDAEANTLTFDLEHIGVVVTGFAAFVGTFIMSRFSTVR